MKSPKKQLKTHGGFRKTKAPVYLTVIKIRDNIVDSCNLYTNVKAAEEDFIITSLDLGARKDDMDTHLDNGYYFHANTSVYIVWPDFKKG
jgi:hypothetical protein